MVVLLIFIFFNLLVIAVVTFIAYIIAAIRKKPTILGLVAGISFIMSIVAFIILINISSKQVENYVIPENKEAVISIRDYSRAQSSHVLAALGEPDYRSEKTFDDRDKRLTVASTWTYYDKRLEFYFINEKLVQFTYYGNDQPYKDINDVFNLFGFSPPAELVVISDNGKMIRYKNSDRYGYIEEFSLTYGTSNNTIGIIKVTYDSKYF